MKLVPGEFMISRIGSNEIPMQGVVEEKNDSTVKVKVVDPRWQLVEEWGVLKGQVDRYEEGFKREYGKEAADMLVDTEKEALLRGFFVGGALKAIKPCNGLLAHAKERATSYREQQEKQQKVKNTEYREL